MENTPSRRSHRRLEKEQREREERAREPQQQQEELRKELPRCKRPRVKFVKLTEPGERTTPSSAPADNGPLPNWQTVQNRIVQKLGKRSALMMASPPEGVVVVKQELTTSRSPSPSSTPMAMLSSSSSSSSLQLVLKRQDETTRAQQEATDHKWPTGVDPADRRRLQKTFHTNRKRRWEEARVWAEKMRDTALREEQIQVRAAAEHRIVRWKEIDAAYFRRLEQDDSAELAHYTESLEREHQRARDRNEILELRRNIEELERARLQDAESRVDLMQKAVDEERRRIQNLRG